MPSLFSHYSDTLQRMFPKAREITPDFYRRPSYAPVGWQPMPPAPYWNLGHRPPDAFPIDDEVHALVMKRNTSAGAPCLLPKEVLETRYVRDPYAVAREFVALAEARRLKLIEDDKAARDRANSLRRAIAQDTKVLDALRRYTKQIRTRSILPDPPGSTEASRPHQIRTTVDSLMGLLQSDNAEKQQRLPSGQRGRRSDAAAKVFVEQMGRCWHLLTGRDPSSQGPFVGFVEQAFACFHPRTQSASSITRAVIKDVSDAEDWERFDRDAMGRLPPGFDVTSVFVGRTLLQLDAETSRFLPPQLLWSGEAFRWINARRCLIEDLYDALQTGLSHSAGLTLAEDDQATWKLVWTQLRATFSDDERSMVEARSGRQLH